MALMTDVSYAGSSITIKAPLQGYPIINCSLDNREDSFVWEEEDFVTVDKNASFETYYWNSPKPRKLTIALTPNGIGAEQVLAIVNRGQESPKFPKGGISIYMITPQGKVISFIDCAIMGGVSVLTGKGDGSFASAKIKVVVGKVVR